MNIFRLYKKTGFFVWINIIGLSIGLSVSILLILFVVNELSYDKHIMDNERIVRLTTNNFFDMSKYSPITSRKAYTEVPDKVPGVEAVVQLYSNGESEFMKEDERFNDIKFMLADPEYFNVFKMKFIAGTPETALADKRSLVLTDETAKVIFGDVYAALGKKLYAAADTFVVSAVVEAYPYNTHLTFDALGNINTLGWLPWANLEFYTYYRIKPSVSVNETRAAIEKEYTIASEAFSKQVNKEFDGKTEMLSDIYLKSDAGNPWGKSSNMKFVWLLTLLSVFILILAVTNFINLFMAQGETRMREIGVRKTFGALIPDIVKQFFSEITVVVAIAFVVGFLLTIVLIPYFSDIVSREVQLSQLLTPSFIIAGTTLFFLTIILSAFYPSFYLSRFNPLTILNKQVSFSKRKLNVFVVVFQSFISIVLISFILIIYQQISFLQNLPLGYNPDKVVTVFCNRNILNSFDAVKQELLASSDVKMVSAGHHLIGAGASGQLIKKRELDKDPVLISEYRVLPGLCELMEFQLVEGEFFKSTTHDSIRQVVLNEAAVKALDLEPPVIGKKLFYGGNTELIGVVKDFYYANPAEKIAPIMFTRVSYPGSVYLKFNDGVSRMEAEQIILDVLRKFDPDYTLDSRWSEDVYANKFKDMKINLKVIMIASLLSVFIAMMGLMAMHLYSTIRRTKEICLRRINGASRTNIYGLLSTDVVKWVVLAGILAAPVTYLIAYELLKENYNSISLNGGIFIIPILVQMIVAILTTSGVTLKALSVNPATVLKQE